MNTLKTEEELKAAPPGTYIVAGGAADEMVRQMRSSALHMQKLGRIERREPPPYVDQFEDWALAQKGSPYYLEMNKWRFNTGSSWYKAPRTQHAYEGFAAAMTIMEKNK